MTPVEIIMVREKLARIMESLELLRPIAELSYGKYLEQVYWRKAAERLLQTSVEAAVDINNHLLVSTGHPPATDYFETFVEVSQKLQVFDLDFAEAVAPSTGLRNRLVHEYDRLDDGIVFTSIHEMLELYPRYVQAVLDYLKTQEGKGKDEG